MNIVPVETSLIGEVLPPGSTIRAVGKTNPFNGGRIDRHLPAGLSITEIMVEALADRSDLILRRDFIVHLDGHPIEENNWSRVRPKVGTTITFTPRLQDGAMMRTALSVVVAVAAFVVAGPLGSAIAETAVGAALISAGMTASTMGALAAGGVVATGCISNSALFEADGVVVLVLSAASSSQTNDGLHGSSSGRSDSAAPRS